MQLKLANLKAWNSVYDDVIKWLIYGMPKMIFELIKMVWKNTHYKIFNKLKIFISF